MTTQNLYNGDSVTLNTGFVINAGVITCQVWTGERVNVITDNHPDNAGLEGEHRLYQVERPRDRLTFWIRGSHVRD
jgi:hypothetical protein